METRPDLSIIVVTYNGREMALTTLRSAQAGLGDITAEWFVVDNGSSDGTADAIEQAFPDVRVFRESNRGFAAGNNVALPHARGRYVLLLNPDVEIAVGTLADLVRSLDERPRVGAASVIQQGSDGQVLPSIRRFPSPARALGEALGAARLRPLHRLQELDLDFPAYQRERSVDWLVGAFLVVRAEVVEEVGLMDDGFFLYAEETDWCRRIAARGWDIRHLPTLTITHHEGDNKRPEMVAQLATSRRRFIYKHFEKPAAVAMHASLVLGHALRLAMLVPMAPFKPGLRPRVRAEAFGLAVLCGTAQPPFGSR
ncbi:hypothetical protein C8N24_3975 [Solirubrobacter pauli]|uniref:Glycosyltransferase 2-like domain-containing protein n=1 Tax=Solirubrobacter pauli TaxID=166793 RepID=A0A660LG60_9ACTN|nr:glycosyltransferase family 2 protein [Solirubrobacter pauli]RKQ94098.1 hypothetical protein C8N24_3975 [Solirubrobacter pauli]